MNISAVSFSGTNRSYYNNTTNTRTNRQSYRNSAQQDEFHTSRPVEPKEPRGKQTKKKGLPLPLTTFIIGTAFSCLVNMGITAEPNEKLLTIPFDYNQISIHELAEIYNINEQVLLDFNNITINTNFADLEEIKVPYSFDYVNDEIEELKTKLYSKRLDADERREIENRIIALNAKQDEQDCVACAYSDGKYVYYVIEFDEDAPEDIKDKYQYGINVETFKKLFDIKDKAIRRHNDLDSDWEANENGQGGYYDYTGNWFHNGDIIKVPVSAVKIDDIDLSKYLEE